MSNPDHVRILNSGKTAWLEWRKENPAVRPDLSKAKFRGMNFSSFDFNNANLRGTSFHRCNLQGANLNEADLQGGGLFQCNLREAKLNGADLSGCFARFARFSGAKLARAKLVGADLRAGSLRRADLTGANLSQAILRFASLVGATVTNANLREAEVYGISAWNLIGEPKNQDRLIIREEFGAIATTVNDLETAQFLFLLRENAKIAQVINTASQRTVLLLGRFATPYKTVLDGLKVHLLSRNLVPILFDFEASNARDLTETVAILAHMCCFVIPDLSGAKSVPQELSVIVPFLPSVPVLPIIAEAEGKDGVYSMFEHFQRYPWVHEPVRYKDVDQLMTIVDERVIDVGFREAMASRGIENAELPVLPKIANKAPRKKK